MEINTTTTSFIQNDPSFETSSSTAEPKSPLNANSSLLTQLKKSLQDTQDELNEQIIVNNDLKIFKTKYADLQNEYEHLATRYETLEGEKKFVDIEVTNLRKETEELSSQLFDEANTMVSDARKEAFEVKKINDSLRNEISEKDNMIQMLQSQLNELKNMIEVDAQNLQINTVINSELTTTTSSRLTVSIDENDTELKSIQTPGEPNYSKTKPKPVSNINNLNNFIYAPTVQSLRYDITVYDLFVSFGKKFYNNSIQNSPQNSKIEFMEIKDHKFFKKVLNDDVEPALRLDEAPGVAWLSKKSLINSMLIGKVSIEPISSVNESYKTEATALDFESAEPPVAIQNPCSLCGESRNDTLDHNRLYVLKVIGTKRTKENAELPYISNQYPLCSYCLHRVRSVCAFFAFLRAVRSGVWKFDNDFHCFKSWIECVRLRTKIFYSRIGIIESTHNLINNNGAVFSDQQLGIDTTCIGYFSNPGSKLTSPTNVTFSVTPLESELPETSVSRASSIFAKRSSFIGNFWNSGNKPNSGKTADNKDSNSSLNIGDISVGSVNNENSVYNEKSQTVSPRLESTLDEALSPTASETHLNLNDESFFEKADNDSLYFDEETENPELPPRTGLPHKKETAEPKDDTAKLMHEALIVVQSKDLPLSDTEKIKAHTSKSIKENGTETKDHITLNDKLEKKKEENGKGDGSKEETYKVEEARNEDQSQEVQAGKKNENSKEEEPDKVNASGREEGSEANGELEVKNEEEAASDSPQKETKESAESEVTEAKKEVKAATLEISEIVVPKTLDPKAK